MAKIYYNLIIAEKITLDQVPVKYKDEVIEMLEG